MARRKTSATCSRTEQAREREDRWRRTLAQWRESGLSQAAFCREHGLPVATLRWWKRELGRRDAVKAGRRTARPRSSASHGGEVGFAPVRVVGALGDIPVAHGGLEVVLVGGRRVRVGSGVDRELLSMVVSVLEGLAC
jgi:hypothetical protein